MLRAAAAVFGWVRRLIGSESHRGEALAAPVTVTSSDGCSGERRRRRHSELGDADLSDSDGDSSSPPTAATAASAAVVAEQRGVCDVGGGVTCLLRRGTYQTVAEHTVRGKAVDAGRDIVADGSASLRPAIMDAAVRLPNDACGRLVAAVFENKQATVLEILRPTLAVACARRLARRVGGSLQSVRDDSLDGGTSAHRVRV